MVYDNVDNIADIASYFPIDLNTWGAGQVILTTQDHTLQNNKHLHHTLQIDELSDDQKFTLFTKIMFADKSSRSSSQESIKTFLKEIPPFPLDVSVAAYYLKATNLSFESYLERLNKYTQDFEGIQQNLIKEADGYTKTRYSLITLSLQRLINSHKDFLDLLFLISLINPQNIPRDLLNAYKDKTIVDNFIYNLNKYSLLINEIDSSSMTSSLSIHRSTQGINLTYILQQLNLEKPSKILEISSVLENYAKNIRTKKRSGTDEVNNSSLRKLLKS